MEMFELRYFIKVSETENIQKASKLLNISPSAISKAISRLETELEVKLFEKRGRNIIITDQGLQLKKDASQILSLEKKIRDEYSFEKDNFKLKIVGSELALSAWGAKIVSKIKDQFSSFQFELKVTSNEEALAMVNEYRADIALFCSPKKLSSKFYKKLEETKFKTFISSKHELSKRKKVKVEELLEHHFIVADSSLLGLNHIKNDGWRDDKFFRKERFITNSLSCLTSLVSDGISISYLPEYFGKQVGLKALEVTGCPYDCHQNIYIVRNKYGLEKVWSLL